MNSTKVETFLRKFQWDNARYQFSGRQLSEIVSQIQSMAAKVDDELKKLSLLYNEKTLALSTLQRKKTVNVSTSDFEDFMKPAAVARLELINSETLLTIMVVVPASLEKGKFWIRIIRLSLLPGSQLPSSLSHHFPKLYRSFFNHYIVLFFISYYFKNLSILMPTLGLELRHLGDLTGAPKCPAEMMVSSDQAFKETERRAVQWSLGAIREF